jgi:HD superfamily phosphodiesterase
MISAREEGQIWTHAVVFLEQGRPGDLDHTRAVVANGKILLAKEGGNPRVVIPTLILHDIGWGRVDFSDFIAAPAEAKRDVESVHLHMQYGAQLASDILNHLGWDEESIRKITSIIAVHDIPEKVLALDDLDATLVFEADWLDKYVPERQNRYFGVVPDRAELKEIKEYLKGNRSRWFRTKTSGELLNRIISRRNKA